MSEINETHNPALRSWIESANASKTDFPIQNLPFGVFRRRSSSEAFRGGVAIGDQIVDLAAAHNSGVFSSLAAEGARAASGENLNAFMALGPQIWSELRLALSRALRPGGVEKTMLQHCLVAQAEVEYALPAQIGDYTDFYVGVHHATAVGKMFRPDQPLMPNYKWVPIGYHGRASSIVVSGEHIARPRGQARGEGQTPLFGLSKKLDYELELAIYVGPGNKRGEPIAIDQAEAHIFGISLFNDWSARDIQPWEYQPLGPFLSKNFASTVSPWIVTLEALAPFRTPFTRSLEDPQPLTYLDCAANRNHGALDVNLEVWLQTSHMRKAGEDAILLSSSNANEAAYWTPAQLVAHHTVSGCNLRPGDLFGFRNSLWTGARSGRFAARIGAGRRSAGEIVKRGNARLP